LEYRNVFPSSEVVGQPIIGEVLLYQYSAKYAEQLPFYDRNPMTYIVAMENNAFYGVNLHYTKPSNRSGVLDYILADQDYTKLDGFNKYLRSYVQGMFLQLKGDDVDKALGMRLEQFVKDVGSIELPMSNQKIRRLLR
tara:strand:+ start:4799 stop:5212 length:414 start_codon:yes stop_codon:yes gene_type:complete